jgi:hypothetical protein
MVDPNKSSHSSYEDGAAGIVKADEEKEGAARIVPPEEKEKSS